MSDKHTNASNVYTWWTFTHSRWPKSSILHGSVDLRWTPNRYWFVISANEMKDKQRLLRYYMRSSVPTVIIGHSCTHTHTHSKKIIIYNRFKKRNEGNHFVDKTTNCFQPETGKTAIKCVGSFSTVFML